MFGMGTQELIVVLVIALLVFGAKNLPNLGKNLGQAITGFKKGLEDREGSSDVSEPADKEGNKKR